VEGDIAPFVSELDLESFDLILIDDSKTSAERAATICAVASKEPQRPLIAIHDFEVGEYQQAATRFRGDTSSGLTLRKQVSFQIQQSTSERVFEAVSKRECSNLKPDDIDAWIKMFC
jgi:hypothetical protein